MTDIDFDAGGVGDTVAHTKTALDEVLSGDSGEVNVSDTRVAEALERIRGTTQEDKGEAEGHLDKGAGAARAMEVSDAEGAGAAAAINSDAGPSAGAGAGGGGAARVQPGVQVTPAALAQMAGTAQPAMPMASPIMKQMANPMSNLMGAANMVAPMASHVAQAAAAPVMPSPSGKIALTPDQQARLIEALSEGGGSSSKGGLDLGSSGGKLFDIAKSLVAADIPYAWGGGTLEGPSQGISDGGGAADAHGDYNKVGYDCSGLSRYVHFQLTGEEVPRTSEAQYAAGSEVSAEEAKPGDFVFPNSSFGGGGPGHVQIYLGDGKVLEAPQSGDQVKISEMTPSIIKRM